MTNFRATTRQYFVGALASAAAAGTLGRVAGAQSRLTPLRVGGSVADDMTAVVYAQQTRMFARAGLDVSIEKTSSGSAAAAAVAAGTYDIAKSSITSIFDAHARGIPFTLLAPAAIYESRNPYGGLLLPANSKLELGKDAEGQTIGVASLGSIGRVAAGAWIAQHGGDVSAVKFVEIPIPTVTAALDQKRIVAGEVGQPALADALAKGYRLIPAYNAIAARFVLAVYYTTRDFSAKHPDALRAFVRVLYDAGRQLNANPRPATKMMAAFIGVPLEVMEDTPRITLGTELVLSQVQSPIDADAKFGTLKSAFRARELLDATVVAH
jgi:NitT/TauT family transport system substrate-binding protein